tara:strand:+ start:1202 stop:2215 length:1014 start_codon:yes stop_codon:yes gene_type:complete
MKEKLISSLKYLFFLSIGVLIIYYVFKDLDLKKMVEDLKNADYKYLFASMVFGYLAYFFRGLRWLMLLKTMNYKTTVTLATHSIAAGYFANALFPRAGEIVRCTSLYKVTGIPVNKLFGTILLERAIDLIMLVLCICLSLILKFKALSSFAMKAIGNESDQKSNYTTLIVFLALFLFFILLYIFWGKIKQSPTIIKILSLWQGVKEGFQAAFHMQQKGLFVLYTVLIWFMYLLMTYVCFFSFVDTEGLSLVDGLYITVVGGLGMIVPVQGGLGPYHAAVTMGVVSIGLSEITGVTLAVLIHTTQSIMILLTGIIATIVLSFAKRTLDTDETSEPSSI